jgi:hypothetical protein
MTRADYYYGRACDAWFRKCQKLGAVPTQPSRELSTVDLGHPFAVVRLRNVNGRLGTYRYRSTRPTGAMGLSHRDEERPRRRPDRPGSLDASHHQEGETG